MYQNRLKNRLILVFTAGLFGLNTQADFTFADFSSIADLTLNRNTAQSGNVLRIVPAAGSGIRRGTAWFNTKQSIADGFETEFTFSMDNTANGGNGLVFVIQNSTDGTAALGGGLGYRNLENSLAVEFDSRQAGFETNDNHVAIHSNGTAANTPNNSAQLAKVQPVFDLNDGAFHTARIAYVPGTMEIFLDGSVTADLSLTVDLDTLLNLDNGTAYVGFSGRTASGIDQNHDIGSWSFTATTDVPEPGTYVMFATLIVGAVLMGIRNKKKSQEAAAGEGHFVA